MAFLVHRAERADLLVEGLAELLREPPSDPFARELVIVPARGVERWLSQRLSHRLGPSPGQDDGICAAVDFRSPGSLVADLIGARGNDPWSPDALVWPLLQVVDASAGEPWCTTLSEHLGHGKTGEELDLRQGRRYATARRLARLFGEYAVQRPTLLTNWESGRDTDGFEGAPLDPDLHWQAELWRRLVSVVAQPSPVLRHAAVLERLRAAPETFELPDRISFFGHTRIPSSELALLEALAEHRDVHLWMPHPSPALWGALDAVAAGTVARTADLSHELVGHPLLASLGRDLRELQRHLPTGDVVGPPTPAGTSLLQHLQADIAGNALPASPRPLDPSDRSISVHACHGPARQVEVLREVISGLLADDDTLEPRDILVMCPDIEAYA
ncbi:MAG: exodeoxyribonuclease V subunit gamma, partial [Microbacterium sp.]